MTTMEDSDEELTFRRAQGLALIHARTIGAPTPLAAYGRGVRGKDWYVVAVNHPKWIVDSDMEYANPDLPMFIVHDDGTVETQQTPEGPLFKGTVVVGEVLDLAVALREN